MTHFRRSEISLPLSRDLPLPKPASRLTDRMACSSDVTLNPCPYPMRIYHPAPSGHGLSNTRSEAICQEKRRKTEKIIQKQPIRLAFGRALPRKHRLFDVMMGRPITFRSDREADPPGPHPVFAESSVPRSRAPCRQPAGRPVRDCSAPGDGPGRTGRHS